jgi:hypothetical protein
MTVEKITREATGYAPTQTDNGKEVATNLFGTNPKRQKQIFLCVKYVEPPEMP